MFKELPNRYFLFPIKNLIGQELFERLQKDHYKTDRFIFNLLLFHWVFSMTLFPALFSNFSLGIFGGGAVMTISFYAYRVHRGTMVSRYVLSNALVCFTFIFIQQSLGKLEAHFHFWIVLGILLSYKDPRPIILVSLVILLHHIGLNYCQEMNFYLGDNPLIVYETGASWFVTFLHALFVIPSTLMYSRISTIALKDFLVIENHNVNLDSLVKERTAEVDLQKSEIEKQNKDLDDFASIISHDLKAPLRSISGLIHILQEDFQGKMDEEMTRIFGMIQERTSLMDNLINGIIAYSRINKQEPVIEDFYINDLLQEIVNSLGYPEGDFTFHFPKSNPKIRSCRIHLFQILSNLMDNAVKYHDKETANIFVDLDVQEEYLFFQVRDDGPGIAEQFHEKVFTIFETVHQKPNVKSSGIGLAIVKKLVEFNKGKIGLESELEKGSTFWFTCPKV